MSSNGYTSQSTTTTDHNITMTSIMPATKTFETTASRQTTLNFSTTLNESSTRAENGTVQSVFQDIDVCCEQREGISVTTCSVMMKLSAPRNSCCFLHALRNYSLTSNKSILATIQNNKVKLIRNIFPVQSTAAPSGGNMSPCNSSQNCSSNITTSSSINCTSSQDPPYSNEDTCSDFEPPCDCSQSCGAAAHYLMDITINNNSITLENITALVNQLNESSFQNHNISNAALQALTDISAVYTKCNVVCGNTGSLRVIVTLSQHRDSCTVNTALFYLLNQTGIIITSKAQRVAICGGNETLSDDLPCGNITVDRVTFNHSQFCNSRYVLWNFLKCQPGRTTIVKLNQDCTSSDQTDTTTKASTTAPPTLTSTSSSTTRSVTTTNHISNTNTTRSANTTTSAGGSTSNSTTQSSGAPVTNVSTSAAQTTSEANVSTITNSSSVSTVSSPTGTVTNSSSVGTVSSPTGTVTNSSSVGGATQSSSITVNTTPTIHNQGTATVAATTTAANNVSAEEKANQLLALTQDASSLNSSQVEQLVSQLEVLLSGPNVSLALGQTSVHITNNLLNASVEAVASSSTRLIRIVDTVGLKLVVTQQSQSILFDSLALAVSRVDGTNFRETTFSLADPNNLQIRSRARSFSWVAGRSDTPQGAITLPSTLTQNLSLQQQQDASRVQFNFYQRSTFFQDTSGKLNSGILSTSVSNLSISGLQDNVTIILRHNKPIPENSTVFCAFWDFTLNGGSGGWNDVGCTVVNVTDDRTICSCSHLTSFGILLDLSRGDGITSRLQATILTYITYIGCGISAIFLSVTLLTYLGFDKLRKDIPSKILIQLCFALLLLNLTFLVDAWLALYPDAVGLCISTAFFLHYFLLCAFTWMGLEAVHMYIALVKVFNNYISRFMLKFSLVGWGVPMAVVIIVIAINKDNYGLISYGKFDDGTTDEFCWIRNDIAFYVAVVAYFCVIFLMNLVMFVVVLVQLYRIKRQNPHNSQHRSHLQDARSVAGLTVLLGLTWGFAFFAWGPVNLAFMYLFAIFNTLQGLFIFILHCAVKENVRRQWRTYLCCGKLRLSENSDWSRTATQNKNRAPSSYAYSRSQNSSSSTTCLAPDSSVRTNSTRGRGSPSDDRMMSDSDTNSDVVQNEINNHYHNPSHSQAEWIRRPSDTRGP